MAASPRVKQRWRDRDRLLRKLGFQSYDDYLASPHWQVVKVRYRASDHRQDCVCGAQDVQLHHKTYDTLGNEGPGDLMPLCRTCHVMIHVLERRGVIGLDLAGLASTERAALYAEATAQRVAQAEQDRAALRPFKVENTVDADLIARRADRHRRIREMRQRQRASR